MKKEYYTLFKKFPLLIISIVVVAFSGLAQTAGEYAYQADGVTPATVGQACNDHLFVRMENSDDDKMFLKSRSSNLMWIWLDDDAIYQNEAVQSLTPIPYNAAGDLYNEITYNSFQCDIYLPEGISLVLGTDEEGNEIYCERGDRLPNTSNFSFSQINDSKIIDGISYSVYTLVMFNDKPYGCHFSARNASRYATHGALKKDDAALFGIYLSCESSAQGQIDDIIIANILFNFRESYVAGWDNNQKLFFYGEGGNDEEQRFMKYHRIETYVNASSVLASSISLNKSNLSLTVGNSEQLTATVLPANTTNKSVSWNSSDNSIATVNSDGVVTAIKPGTATITATTTDGTNLSASCAVTVEPVYATSINLNTSSVTLDTGESYQLSATVSPSNATNNSVSWTSSNAFVAKVDQNGLVMAIEPGTTVITARTTDGSDLSASCTVTVEQKVTSIALNETSATIILPEKLQLSAIITPSNATNQTVAWSSSNGSVASVDENGLVSSLKVGRTTITATTTDGSDLSASCVVIVEPVYATAITLNTTNVTLEVDENYLLTATVYPSNATNKTVSWTSSDTSVARVNQEGLVTTINPGTAVITARTTDGTDLSASCTVTVERKVTSIALDKSVASIIIPETLQLTAIIAPADATNKTVTWSSSNNSIASVDENGLVTPKKAGNVTITATTNDGTNLSASCDVTVIEQKVTEITLNYSELSMTTGETIQLLATVLPDNASNPSLSWSSSNSTVASVNANGFVTALKAGNTVITARATDGSGIVATCSIQVIPAYYLTLDTLTAICGQNDKIVDLPISLVNKSLVSGIQFDIYLPSCVSFYEIDGLPDIWIDDNRKTGNHELSVTQLSNNGCRVLISSPTAKELKGNDGVLVHINVNVPTMSEAGNFPINVNNIVASDADETRHQLDAVQSCVSVYYIVGDADCDASVDIADYMTTASYILLKNPTPFYKNAADVDENNNIDVADLVGITNIALAIKPITLRQVPQWENGFNRMLCEILAINPGETKQLGIGLDANFVFAGFQMDCVLPNGLSLVEAKLSEDASGLDVTTVNLDEGKVRLLASSFSDKEIDGYCPELLTLVVKADNSYNYEDRIGFDNVVFAERNLTSHYFDGTSIEFVQPSDVNELSGGPRIYIENGNIVVETPVAGTVQVISTDGRMVEYRANVGRNVYKTLSDGIYIVNFNGKVMKVRL